MEIPEIEFKRKITTKWVSGKKKERLIMLYFCLSHRINDERVKTPDSEVSGEYLL